MQNTPIFGLPYIEGTDLVEDIATASRTFVEGVEAIMTGPDFHGPEGREGPPGPKGLPGVNALPADEAVAAYVRSTASQTNLALGERYGDAALAALAASPSSALNTAVLSLIAGGYSSDAAVASLVGNPATNTATALTSFVKALISGARGDKPWTPITIKAGFAAQGETPTVCVRDNIVYWRGGFAATGLTTSAGFEIADLPAGFYPGKYEYGGTSSQNALIPPGRYMIRDNGSISLSTGPTLGTYYLPSVRPYPLN